MTGQLHCYRVWMKDGYVSLQNAESEDDAKELAIALAQKTIAGYRMTAAQKRAATTVDYAERLSAK